MRVDLPDAHIRQAMSLEAEGYVLLVEITMRDPAGGFVTLNMSQTVERVWQGKTWQGWPFAISETGVNSTGETVRPKISIANLQGLWSRYVHQRYADNAIVKKYKVLKSAVDANTNEFELNSWRWSKTLSLGKDLVVGELRTALDGQTFRIPADTYRPPEYPTVSVQ